MASGWRCADAPWAHVLSFGHMLLLMSMCARCGRLKAKGEREPHIIIASFVLHYLDTEARNAFFRQLSELASHPFILLIIKGVGEAPPPS